MLKIVALVCLTYLASVFGALIMVSDVFLRSQNIPGTDPRSWDVIGSFILYSALGSIAFALASREK